MSLTSPDVLYGLVLLAAVAHASWNALIKGARDRLLMMATIRFVGLVFGLALLPFVPAPAPEAWGILAMDVVAHLVYFALLLHSYRVGDLSLVYPIARGLAPLLLAGAAYLIVDERLGPYQWAAVALTSVGILLLVVGRRIQAAPVLFAAATSVSIASYSLLGGLGVRSAGTVLGFHAWLEILTGVGFIAFAMLRRGGAVPAFVRRSGWTGLAVGVISVGGYLAYLLAVSVLPMGPVSALRESSVIFGTIIGALAFKEGFGARRVTAAVLVTTGIVALGVLRP